jgi:hypothetical protein
MVWATKSMWVASGVSCIVMDTCGGNEEAGALLQMCVAYALTFLNDEVSTSRAWHGAADPRGIYSCLIDEHGPYVNVVLQELHLWGVLPWT